jgi:hypothetical protein
LDGRLWPLSVVYQSGNPLVESVIDVSTRIVEEGPDSGQCQTAEIHFASRRSRAGLEGDYTPWFFPQVNVPLQAIQ